MDHFLLRCLDDMEKANTLVARNIKGYFHTMGSCLSCSYHIKGAHCLFIGIAMQLRCQMAYSHDNDARLTWEE